MALDLQPDDLAGRVQELQHYDFVSSEAREHFEELMEELRQEVADTYFQGASEALGSMDPEQMAPDARRRSTPSTACSSSASGASRWTRASSSSWSSSATCSPATPDPRRAARAAGPADGGGRGHVALAVARAAGPAAPAGRVPARGHGPALAGGAAGRQPAAGLPRRRLAQSYGFSGRGPDGDGRGHRPGLAAGRARPHGGAPAVGLLAGRPVRDRPGPGAAATWARTPPARWTGWPS